MKTQIATRPNLVVMPNTATPADRSIEKRRIRKHFVLNVIREYGPLSRADISKISGYNLPSVSNLVDDLVRDQLVLEEEAKEVPRGRRPIPIVLNGKGACLLGIDVGWRTTGAVLMNLGGEVLHHFERPTPEFHHPSDQADWVQEISEELLEVNEGNLPPLCGIGVGIPGLIAKENGNSLSSQETTHAIRRQLQEEMQVPVIIQNDARMMALGACWFGEGKNYSTFAVLNIGHGLGLGMVQNGRIMEGAHGFAGEIGHIPLGDPGVPCYCGSTGCLENAASGAGIIRLAKNRGLEVDEVSEVASLARKGNRNAQEVFEEFSDGLARAIATVVNLFDPQAVILSGRVSQAKDLFLRQTETRLKEHSLPDILGSSVLLVSEQSSDLGPLGAAASVLHHIFYSAHVQVEEVI